MRNPQISSIMHILLLKLIQTSSYSKTQSMILDEFFFFLGGYKSKLKKISKWIGSTLWDAFSGEFDVQSGQVR